MVELIKLSFCLSITPWRLLSFTLRLLYSRKGHAMALSVSLFPAFLMRWSPRHPAKSENPRVINCLPPPPPSKSLVQIFILYIMFRFSICYCLFLGWSLEFSKPPSTNSRKRGMSVFPFLSCSSLCVPLGTWQYSVLSEIRYAIPGALHYFV